MEHEQSGKLVPLTVLLTPEQVAWVHAAAKHTGETPDDVIRDALQVLKRLSAYRDVKT